MACGQRAAWSTSLGIGQLDGRTGHTTVNVGIEPRAHSAARALSSVRMERAASPNLEQPGRTGAYFTVGIEQRARSAPA